MEVLHHIVAKLLNVSKRTRVDIVLTVLYPCTRLSCTTSEDWGKLRRLLHYLNDTIDMARVIGTSEGMNILQTYVDAYYAIYSDKKGRT